MASEQQGVRSVADQGWLWRNGLLNASFVLSVGTVLLGAARRWQYRDDVGTTEFVTVLGIAVVAAAAWLVRTLRSRVDITTDRLVVRNPIRTVTVKRDAVVELRPRTAYVGAEYLRLVYRHGGRHRAVTVVALPFSAAGEEIGTDLGPPDQRS